MRDKAKILPPEGASSEGFVEARGDIVSVDWSEEFESIG